MLRLAPFVLTAALACGAAQAQVPAGPDFQVNTYTTLDQTEAQVSIGPAGDFVVAWQSQIQANGPFSVRAQRYQADGAALGGEFRVDTGAFGAAPSVAHAPTGRFVVAWHNVDPQGRFDVHARRFTPQGVAGGVEFTVNATTADSEYAPELAPLPGGGFVAAWSEVYAYALHPDRILAQRYDAFGQRVGAEIAVNVAPAGFRTRPPKVAASADGRFVVAWRQVEASGPAHFIEARPYDAGGNAVAPAFVVQTSPQTGDTYPGVGVQPGGAFVIVWQNLDDGSNNRIRARRFSPTAMPIGSEFAVSSATTGAQFRPSVAADRRGDFVVVWTTRPGSSLEVFARRFDAAGNPRGGNFQVNSLAVGVQFATHVASDEVGNFVVAWSSDDYNGPADYNVMARRFGGLLPMALAVDTAASPQSDGNGVLEPGESAAFTPSWRNVNGTAQTFTGTLPLFTGPAGATYGITDGSASYGTVANATTAACNDCYAIAVSAPPSRPQPHWDAVANEDLAPDSQGQREQWSVHIGDTFADVARSSPFYPFVETLVHHTITAGCGGTLYCPQGSTTREQMSVFVVVARDHAGDPPPACGTPIFGDVPASSPYCRWIEELARSGVVAGCGGGNFCPGGAVSREEMSVFVLRTLDPTLDPPACGAPIFSDVPASSPFCRWIEELARRGVVSGCGGGRYCPLDPVTREQVAVFIAAGFGLRLYGP